MAGSSAEYIPHHLEHLRYDLAQGKFVTGAEGIVNFNVLNVDTLIMSAGLGLLFLILFRLAAGKATAGERYSSSNLRVYWFPTSCIWEKCGPKVGRSVFRSLSNPLGPFQ